jgi:hypothetical protein
MAHTFTTTMHMSSELFSTMTYLRPFERVDQTAFADVWEANDADGDTLRRARFVRLEAEQCRGHARCQVRTPMRTRKAEWEHRGCVAEVFEPCLGVLAWHQV